MQQQRTIDSIELITKIRYMMEYMTLCADPTLFEKNSAVQPSPSGVPMAIVTMPDFVVDIAMDGIASSGRGQLEPMDVGGRAGRLAWVLQGFGGLRNAWYSVKYVAKAGDVGRVVLRRRFAKKEGQSDFCPMSLRYIISSRQDYDWLHVYGNPLAKTVESSYKGLDVKVSDIDESPFSLESLFVDTRYIVISSKYAKHAINAILVVKEGLQRLSELHQKKGWQIPIGILVDLSALGNPDEASQVVESFARMKESASISAFDIESTALCNKELNDVKKLFEYALVTNDEYIQLDNYKVPSPPSKNIVSRPIRRETLTAGYVLASACNLGWKLLRRWYHYFTQMRPIDESPHQSFPQAGDGRPTLSANPGPLLPSLAIDAQDLLSIKNRLDFAVLLGQHTELTPLCYLDLIQALSKPDLPLGKLNYAARREMEYVKASGDKLNPLITELEQKALSNSHLKPRFNDPKSQDTLSLFVPPSETDHFVDSCLLRDIRREVISQQTEIDKAVMFDLDATLVDSAGLLQTCWFNGLRTFFKEANIDINNDGIQTIIVRSRPTASCGVF